MCKSVQFQKIDVNKENELFLPNVESVSVHRYERKNVAAK